MGRLPEGVFICNLSWYLVVTTYITNLRRNMLSMLFLMYLLEQSDLVPIAYILR